MPPLAECEHPAAPPEYGEYLASQVLSTLVSNPDVWAKTVSSSIYDENGGLLRPRAAAHAASRDRPAST